MDQGMELGQVKVLAEAKLNKDVLVIMEAAK